MAGKTKWFLLAIGLSSGLGLGCRNRGPQSAGDLVTHMESKEHGYQREVQIGSTIYTIQLASPQYMAAKESEAGASDTAAMRRRAAQLEGYLYFLIRIQPHGGWRDASVDERATYYATGAEKDLILKAGSQVLYPATYHFEDNQGLTAYNTLIAGFDLSRISDRSVTLVFNDRIAGNSFIQAAFDASDLPTAPVFHL